MDQRYARRNADIRLKRLDGNGVLLNLRTGDFFELDATALAVWQRLDGKTDAGAIARQLARRFKAPVAVVERDVRQFIAVLRRRGLVDLAR